MHVLTFYLVNYTYACIYIVAGNYRLTVRIKFSHFIMNESVTDIYSC